MSPEAIDSMPEVDDVGVVGTDQEIEKRFTYHDPKDGQTERYNLIRDNGKRLAYLIKHNTQPSREQSLAFTHLEQAIMWANASIARNE